MIPLDEHTHALGGHLYNWLARKGHPLVSFTMAPGGEPGRPGYAYAQPGRIHLGAAAAPVSALARRYGRRGRLSDEQVEGARVLLHEGLHQMRYARTPGEYGDGRDEEAIVEAISRDLLPHFTREIYGHRMARVPERHGVYEPGVRDMRQLSTLGSGGPNWRSIPARAWRRSFLHADNAGRAELRARALARRTAAVPVPVPRAPRVRDLPSAPDRPPARAR